MKNSIILKNELKGIDGRGYKAYKDLQGQYDFNDYVLSIDHVQGDPFASPSRIRIIIDKEKAKFPEELINENYKKIAVSDFLTRLFYFNINKYSEKIFGSGKSGLIAISRCPQEILERTSIVINECNIEARFYVGFPAKGRTVLSKELEKILYNVIPSIVDNTLIYENINKAKIIDRVKLVEDQEYIRNELKKKDLIAFVANGSILPRESGVSQRPLKNAMAFKSPNSLEVEMNLPNKGLIKGMGIKRGVTLIVGGGYHGKSTLLNALELGVYNHIEGDGREFVITDDSAVKVRAEDGRSIKNTDISLFINNLPNGKDTVKFTTENASGSTSQAANIIEAIEAKSKVLLIDEDTSATNFMIRDDLMQKLVSKEKEPITPFIEIVKPLYNQKDISTILVIGSSGDYFDVADTVIQMDNYETKDVTKEAKVLMRGEINKRIEEKNLSINIRFNRKLQKGTIESTYKGVKIKTMGLSNISINNENIDLRAVEQLVDNEQLNAIGAIMKWIEYNLMNKNLSLEEVVNEAYSEIKRNDLISIDKINGGSGSIAMPRKQEVMAVYNRFRKLRIN
ncbi:MULTISPECIES: ABC-ATPase domain-containing protein [unclassified Clostridium]|uniref:ABC-ATPase domain-containing protein n=2 Tax=Clostridium TaxID=1485 RepID=UPI0025BF7838|nr:ABC-ATPase domain-containing protein [Clostridium sp.]MCI6691766.1 ABC-ATPase domain-containing protein [Clostridium sp.]MDY2632699.1 ABC-ATPase domain-containing protein [Clostridium sp.]MDY4251332.1 ABC-ATPase domain-containing protein [Clostridium sp.]MDY6227634.1 ABC-ATPase domain-containing protein [Clostridium sp.]